MQSPGTRSVGAGHRALGRHSQPRLPPPSPARARPGARGQAEPQALVWPGVGGRLACLGAWEPGTLRCLGCRGSPSPGLPVGRLEEESRRRDTGSCSADRPSRAWLVGVKTLLPAWVRGLRAGVGTAVGVRSLASPCRSCSVAPRTPGQVRACERGLHPL